MKIELNTIKESSIYEFADKHGLVMQVNERERPHKGLARFYASFKGVEVKDGQLLVGAFGDGETPESAIANYANVISGRTLVIGAFTKNRTEIKADRFV